MCAYAFGLPKRRSGRFPELCGWQKEDEHGAETEPQPIAGKLTDRQTDRQTDRWTDGGAEVVQIAVGPL